MSLVRVHNFSISLDGFGIGEPQSHDAPFGHAGEKLHGWMFTTRQWREMVGEPGGTRGLDDAFVRLHDPGIGAEIIGAGKFGYPGWHEDSEWKGWWGSDPLRGWWITCTSWWSPSFSAAAFGFGMDWRPSRRTIRSRPPPCPAEGPT